MPPFPLLHVDTTWKFRDMYAYREAMARDSGMELLVYINADGVRQGINPFTHGSQVHTDVMKTQALKQALDNYRFDAAFGGARRDEEKSRAKERVFSFRTAQHRWDPKNQRPELWSLYNTEKRDGESIRVFPLSNWTELDVWQYIQLRENSDRAAVFRRRAAGGTPQRRADHGGRRAHAAAARREARSCAGAVPNARAVIR